jgi:hypothetical protein
MPRSFMRSRARAATAPCPRPADGEFGVGSQCIMPRARWNGEPSLSRTRRCRARCSLLAEPCKWGTWEKPMGCLRETIERFRSRGPLQRGFVTNSCRAKSTKCLGASSVDSLKDRRLLWEVGTKLCCRGVMPHCCGRGWDWWSCVPLVLSSVVCLPIESARAGGRPAGGSRRMVYLTRGRMAFPHPVGFLHGWPSRHG